MRGLGRYYYYYFSCVVCVPSAKLMKVRVWNAATGQCLHTATLEAAIISLSFHPSGNVLAIASGQFVYLWDYNVRIRTHLRVNSVSYSSFSACPLELTVAWFRGLRFCYSCECLKQRQKNYECREVRRGRRVKSVTHSRPPPSLVSSLTVLAMGKKLLLHWPRSTYTQ